MIRKVIQGSFTNMYRTYISTLFKTHFSDSRDNRVREKNETRIFYIHLVYLIIFHRQASANNRMSLSLSVSVSLSLSVIDGNNDMGVKSLRPMIGMLLRILLGHLANC